MGWVEGVWWISRGFGGEGQGRWERKEVGCIENGWMEWKRDGWMGFVVYDILIKSHSIGPVLSGRIM